MAEQSKSPQTYIPSVEVNELDQARRAGAFDLSTRTLLKAEFAYIGHWLNRPEARHEAPDPDDPRGKPGTLMGLALSGGGIRSATFCLGVLQALAAKDLLRKFDYLSTVSGGGYIGSSLTWWLQPGATLPDDSPTNLSPEGFPFGTEDPSDPHDTRDRPGQKAALKYLREHGKFLTPGRGLDLVAAVCTSLRGVLLSVLFWFLLFTSAILAARVLWAYVEFTEWVTEFVRVLEYPLRHWLGDWAQITILFNAAVSLPGPFGVALLLSFHLAVVILAVGVLYSPFTVIPSIVFAPFLFVARLAGFAIGRAARLFRAPLQAVMRALGGSTSAIRGAVRRPFDSLRQRANSAGPGTWWRALLGLLHIADVGFTAATSPSAWRYFSRRTVEQGSSWTARTLVALLAFGSIAWVAESWGFLGALAGGGGVASSIGIALWLFRRAQSLKMAGVPFSVLAALGSLFLVFGLLLLAYEAAQYLLQEGLVRWAWAVTLAYGVFANLNLVSIHRFYRDRLMETFTPQRDRIAKDDVPYAFESNDAALDRMWPGPAEWPGRTPNGPFHLINTNVVLVHSSDRVRRLRGGDSFVLSPLYSGSSATGWGLTAEFSGRRLTLPTAMAISGAAANPHTGVGGAGLMRSAAIAWLMKITGISLGYWLRNPARPRLLSTIDFPNYFVPGVYNGTLLSHADIDAGRRGFGRYVLRFPLVLWQQCTGGRFRRKGAFLQLSDGGHFENLGLYELVRRRMRLIVLCDAGADPGYTFSDFQIAIRRIEDDFGASIAFDEDNHLETMMPGSGPASDGPDYPPGVQFARRGYVAGTITYADETKGVLIYLTTTMIRELGIKTKGYATLNPEFPDQSTADQFFDEDQFEAYRELGYRIASLMIRCVKYGDGKTSAVTGLEAMIKHVEAGVIEHPGRAERACPR